MASMVVRNSSGYHLMVQQADLVLGGQAQALARTTVIQPFHELRWPLEHVPADRAGMSMRLRLLNDVGVEVQRDYPLR